MLMGSCHYYVGLFLFIVLRLTSGYEKCTQGISHDECYVGSCCKIDGQWECRTSGLEACDSLAEKDENYTDRPATDTDSTNTTAIIIPVAAGCGCLILLILCAIFAIYIRRRYREKPYVSTYQSRHTGSDSSLVNNSVPANQDTPQLTAPRVWSTRQDDLRYADGRNKQIRDYGHHNPVLNGVHNKRSNGSRTPDSESQNRSSRSSRSRYETSNLELPERRSKGSRRTNNYSTDVNTNLQDLNQEPYCRRPGRPRPRRDTEERPYTLKNPYHNHESSYEKPPSYAEAMNSTEGTIISRGTEV